MQCVSAADVSPPDGRTWPESSSTCNPPWMRLPRQLPRHTSEESSRLHLPLWVSVSEFFYPHGCRQEDDGNVPPWFHASNFVEFSWRLSASIFNSGINVPWLLASSHCPTSGRPLLMISLYFLRLFHSSSTGRTDDKGEKHAKNMPIYFWNGVKIIHDFF